MGACMVISLMGNKYSMMKRRRVASTIGALTLSSRVNSWNTSDCSHLRCDSDNSDVLMLDIRAARAVQSHKSTQHTIYYRYLIRVSNHTISWECQHK